MEFIPINDPAEADTLPRPIVLIRDDDAAAAGADNCYFAAMTDDQEAAEAAYEADGGTVICSEILIEEAS